MSLLLDALKRAEQEKGARQQGGEAPGGPRAANGPALELQPLATTAAPRAPNERPAAHTPPPAFIAPAPVAKSRRGLWIAAGVIGLLALAGGGYVAYSVLALAPRAVATAHRPAPPPAPVAAVAPAAVEVKKDAALAPERAAPAPVAAIATASRAAPPAARAAEATPAESVAAAPPPLQLERTRETKKVDPDLASGYESLRRGDLEAARGRYDAALARDNLSVDALLGLATIDARASNRTQAAQRYRRVLEIDPRNATALAGLAALADLSRPDALEAELVADLGKQPDNASLHFTLGSLYASQARWSQAQAAFFEAHRLDPSNGDVAYNLAVSLDHLGQSRLAAGFYRRALEDAKKQPAQFDAAPAAKRLAELERGER